jgi:PiT family inorganic phosphate transporter
MGKGMIDIKTVTPTVILAGLGGAISWNMITWYFGLPSSSSHALIGGYAGAAIVKSGFGVIIAGDDIYRMADCWVFTIPATALLGGLVYFLCAMVGLN